MSLIAPIGTILEKYRRQKAGPTRALLTFYAIGIPFALGTAGLLFLIDQISDKPEHAEILFAAKMATGLVMMVGATLVVMMRLRRPSATKGP